MSLSAKIARVLMNSMADAGNGEQQLERARKYNSRHKFVMPSDKKAYYRTEKLPDGSDLLIVRSNRRTDNKNCAVLYIFGGGGMMNCWKMHMSAVLEIVNMTGAEVFMPIYPLLTDAPVSAAVEAEYATYKRILRNYPADKTVITGDSSGGSCCLAFISMINKSGEGLNMPKLAILHSPGGVPHSEEAWERMRKQSKKDAPGFFDRVKYFPDICTHGQEIPEYTIYPAKGDFRNAPVTYVYYGAEEVLASLGTDLEEAYARAGSEIHVHYEPGMIHCYSAFPVFPESRKACSEWLGLISEV